MKRLIGILILLLAFGKINSQDFYQKVFEYKKDSIRKSVNKDFPNLFERVNNTNDRMQNSSFNYPLNDGDFWEYIELDTTTLIPNTFKSVLNFSVIKEILGDTLMPNGMTYKIIKWEKCANSINEPADYEYQRNDTSGRVFIYSNRNDYLLYDFNKLINETYPSHYEGYNWVVLKKYTVEYIGKNYAAMDLALKGPYSYEYRNETIIDNFGLTYYRGNINNFETIPEGSFFGGMINDTTYGSLLAKDQKINWSEFYPLNIGDYWIYEVDEGSISNIITMKVIGDTLIKGKILKKILKTDYRFGTTTGYYELFENNSVYNYRTFDSSIVLKYKFSSCIGDTARYSSEYFWRMNEKNYNTLFMFLYPDLSFQGRYFERGIGLSMETFEMGGSFLKGAVINGQIFGDTTITEVENNSILPVDYILYQNYPNPFNTSTIFKFFISRSSFVSLKVYDLLGKMVQSLVEEEKPAGEYQVRFNARNLASGVYVYTLRTDKFSYCRKFILLK